MKILIYQTGPIQVNTYLVFDEKSLHGFVVDPGGHCQKLIDDINNYSIKLEYIILTHGHGDHIGGVEELLKLYDTKLVAGANEIDMLSGNIDNASLELFGKTITLRPDILVQNNDIITVGDMLIKVLFTPGHTPGGICLYTNGIVFSGDTLFRQSVGRTDFPGGDTRQLINSIKDKLYTLPDNTVVLPGHMEKTEIGFEKRNNYFV